LHHFLYQDGLISWSTLAKRGSRVHGGDWRPKLYNTHLLMLLLLLLLLPHSAHLEGKAGGVNQANSGSWGFGEESPTRADENTVSSAVSKREYLRYCFRAGNAL
jgi:hypothetical protein